MTNRLVDSNSPYLIQHAENPVDWFPWGDEAFERATAEDKPVLVSIGYSACHWCHVMAHESFENEATARLMNSQFVNIKVDREERPDVDSVYMDAVQALTGQGGWPLNIFLTPDRRPFFGGTYFPPAPRHGMPSWPQLLQSVAVSWRDQRERVEESADHLTEHLARITEGVPLGGEILPTVLDAAFGSMSQHFDWTHGGFGTGPKFPNALNIEFLLRTWSRTGSEDALRMARLSLDRMAAGGIHDHLGGGFHRYTVDGEWVVPHFEKMLYDNALLARLYTEAWQATGSDLYRRTAESALDYILRDMTAPGGGFYSSEDADSGGVEGKFYVWTQEDIRDSLDITSASLLMRRYGITDKGNFEGKTILTATRDLESVAAEIGLNHREAEASVAESIARLRVVRDRRTRPGRDEKILTDWNALTIAALALASCAFGRDDYMAAAVRAADFVLRELWRRSRGSEAGHRLTHVYKDGPGGIGGFLADYAFLLEAVLALFGATGEERWLQWARELASEMTQLFGDSAGGFYAASQGGSTELPVRPRDLTDGVVPSGTSAAVMGLLTLSRLTDDVELENQAVRLMTQLAPAASEHAVSFGHLLAAIDSYLAPRRELVLVLPANSADGEEFARAAWSRYMPTLVTVTATQEGAIASSSPLFTFKSPQDGRATAYLCENFACAVPVTTAADLQAQLEPISRKSAPG